MMKSKKGWSMRSPNPAGGEGRLPGSEQVGSLLQPDILLSSQYLDSLRSNTYLEPERRLMLAILEDAVACFKNYAVAREKTHRKLFRAAGRTGSWTRRATGSVPSRTSVRSWV